MKNTSKVLLGVGLGALIGGVAGFYMNSPEGKKMQKQMKKKAAKMQKEMAKSIEAGKDQISEQVNQVSSYAKDKMNLLGETIVGVTAQAIDQTDEFSDNVKDDFDKGVDTAKSIVKKQARKIRNAAQEATS